MGVLLDFVIFSIFSFKTPLDFHESFRLEPLKYLVYFVSGINTKQFWNIFAEKYFPPLRIINLSIKNFLNSFAAIASTLFDSLFN